MKIKAAQISLILAILFGILMLPIYFQYCSLVEVDLFSTDLSIENPDQEVLPVDREGDAGMSVLYLFSIVLPPGPGVFKQLQSYSFQISSSFDQRTFLLRC